MGFDVLPKGMVALLENFLIVAGQVLTLFLMMGVGFVLAKSGHFSAETSSQVTRLLLYIVSPCIIIAQFQIDADMAVIRSMLLGGLGMLIPYLFMVPLSQLLYRRENKDTAVVSRFGIVYGNNIFMGMPLLLGVLGEDALLFGALSLLIFNLFEWTHGVIIMGGKLDLKSLLLNPGIIGMAAGLLLFCTGLRLPGAMDAAVDYLTDLNTPLAMVVIGGQIARSDILGALRKPKLYLNAAIKLLLVPALTALILLPLQLEPISYCACVVLAACPTAGATAMFAQMFGRDQDTAAQMITLSTLLSVVTLPVFAVAAQMVSGLTA